MHTRRFASVICLLLALLCSNAAARTIFLVRHAEKAVAAPGSKDPDLSLEGHARARALAAMLKDAGIGAIFVTEFKRTQQTAAPLARAKMLAVHKVEAADTAELLKRLNVSAAANVLVVTHSNTLGEIARGLGAAGDIQIAEDDYDNLFIWNSAEPSAILHLHY